MSGSGYTGFRDPRDSGSDFDAQSFLVNQILNRLATTALVKVTKVTSAGEVAPVGLLDAIPMVHQIDGAGNPTEHGVIHNIPYFRLQGGTNAIIIDPQVGDIGLAVFCSRDISAVKRTKAPANPGSNRRYDWADALYVGGVLNGVPAQYMRYSNDGISVVSHASIALSAPTISIAANNIILQGAVAATGTITSNSHDISSTHRHTASGGTGVGGPPV